MEIPKLKWQLVLEQHYQEPDGAGGYAEGWLSLGTVWAEIRAGTGREQWASGLPVGRVPYRVITPAAPAGSLSRPRADQRFREGERIFWIRAVAERGTNGAYLVCFCDVEEPA